MNTRVLANTAAFAFGGYVGYHFIKGFTKVRREEQAKRARVEAECQREIILMHRANAVVMDRIRTGQYSGMTMSEIEELQKIEKLEQNLLLAPVED